MLLHSRYKRITDDIQAMYCRLTGTASTSSQNTLDSVLLPVSFRASSPSSDLSGLIFTKHLVTIPI